MFSQDKIEELKKIKQELGKVSTKQIINILGEEILELLNKGIQLKLLSDKLSKELDTLPNSCFIFFNSSILS